MAASDPKLIIAIHGAGMQAGIWEILSQNLPCRALSLPGHGETAGPLRSSIADMAAWVEEQIKGRPAGSIVLMGHSMGALVALEAAKSPAVAALVLMGAAARMPVHPDLLKQAATAPEAGAAMILKWGISPSRTEAGGLVKQQMEPTALANDLAACHAYSQGEATAKAVHKPSLVIAGADDKMTKPAEGKALAEILEARFHLASACGHMMMVENPLEIAREIKAFMAAINS
jgi:pimeloyl-ACP methyl ester carboxylesterase